MVDTIMETTKTQKKAYYLAYFEINQDSDFYVELYKDLNFDYKLFEFRLFLFN